MSTTWFPLSLDMIFIQVLSGIQITQHQTIFLFQTTTSNTATCSSTESKAAYDNEYLVHQVDENRLYNNNIGCME